MTAVLGFDWAAAERKATVERELETLRAAVQSAECAKREARDDEACPSYCYPEDRSSTKSDTLDHQAEYRCESRRGKLQHSAQLGRARIVPLRCRRCLPCARWRLAKLQVRMIEGLASWSSVRMLRVEGKDFEALSRRLRRHIKKAEVDCEKTSHDKCDHGRYVSVPVADGRVVFSDHDGVGETVQHTDLSTTIGKVLQELAPGRVQGSAGWERKTSTATVQAKPRAATTWSNVGPIKLDLGRHSRIFSAHGCAQVGTVGVVWPQWDVSTLSGDELLGLWTALGVRTYTRAA